MVKRALTDRAIKSLANKPAKEGKTYDVPDGIVPGLAVRVMPSGQRTFVLVARFPGRKNPTRRAIGAYGAITLDTARERARKWLDLIRRGIDPQTEARVLAERQRNRLACASQREARVRFVDLPGLERDSLDESVRARRLEPGLLELVRDVFGRALVAGAARVASLQRVVREKLDVLPPAVAVSGRDRARGDDERDDCKGALHSCTT